MHANLKRPFRKQRLGLEMRSRLATALLQCQVDVGSAGLNLA